jgi:hypothetical protein
LAEGEAKGAVNSFKRQILPNIFQMAEEGGFKSLEVAFKMGDAVGVSEKKILAEHSKWRKIIVAKSGSGTD